MSTQSNPTTTRALAAGLILAGSLSALAQAEAQPEPPPVTVPWERSAALGLTLTRGNSSTLNVAGNVIATRKSKLDEWSLGADANYGEDRGSRNAASVHGFVQYNRLLTESLYAYGRVDGLHDGIADITYRFTFSPGLGYYFIKNEKTRLSVEVGPGYIYEKQGDKTEGYFTLRVAERFEHKFNDKTKIWQSLEWLPQVDDFSNYIINGEIGLETALTKSLSLRTYLQDTFDNEPAPGRQKNDLKLVTALAYKF